MKFKAITIENFLAITEGTVRLADRGLVLIQGVNKADTSALSNGAGKSSIADALCWCLYGTTARGESGDAVINELAGKNTKVEVMVEDSGMTYIIARHRKHKTGKNSLTVVQNDGMRVTPLTKGTDALTQKVVEQIIGASLEVFTGAVYAGQEKMPDLPAMTDKMLKTVIEEAAGLTLLEAAHVKAREKLSAAKVRLQGTEAAVVNADVVVRNAIDMLRLVNAQRAEWKDHHDAQIRALHEEKTSVANQIQREREALTAMKPQDLIAQRDQITREFAAIKPLQDSCDMQAAVVNKMALDASTKGQLLNQSAHAVQAAESEMLRVPPSASGAPCPSCGTPMNAHSTEKIKQHAEERQVQALKAHTEALRAHAEAAKRLEAEREALTSLQALVPDASDLNRRNEALNQLLMEVNQRATLIKSLSEVGARLEMRIQALIAETLPASLDPTPRKVALQTAEDALAVAEQDRFAAQMDLEVLNEVVVIFGPQGVRSKILDDVTPFLNAQTARYLSALSDGNLTANWSTVTADAKGNLKDKFTIDVSNSVGGKSFKAISGGEKRKVRLATMLALQDLVATRALKPIELFIGDEIDDALDAAGLERLMTVLTEKAKDRGSVFVISHNELKDFISEVVVVEKSKAGITTLTESVV